MIPKIFQKIYDKTSFGFTIVLFSTTWSWIASFYGLYFVYATVNISTWEFEVLMRTLLAGTALAICCHWVHFGALYKIGFPGFTATIRMINRNFNKRHFFRNHQDFSPDEIERIYLSLLKFPRINLLSSLIYTYCVIGSLIAVYFFYSMQHEKALFIVMGGAVASFLIGYFTFLITEYFIGPYKVRIEQILFSLNRSVFNRDILNFRLKSTIMLFIVVFSMLLLTIMIRKSDKPMVEIYGFIALSVITIGTLIFLLINTISAALATINRATGDLAAGGAGIYFPPFSDREFIEFAQHYNRAAMEINGIRANLEEKIAERTDELNRAYQRLNKAYSQIQSDMQLAKRIQRSIISEEFDTMSGIDIKVGYHPIADVGGDIYIIHRIGDNKIRIFLADAIGHGIQAALVTMIIKSEFEKIKDIEVPSEALRILNTSFLDLYFALNAFFSCIIIDIDLDAMCATYSSAGHPDQIAVCEEAILFLPHTGKLIGISCDATYSTGTVPIGRGDKILLFTDGLFEQINERDEIYSEKRVADFVNAHCAAEVKEIMKRLLDEISFFIGDHSETGFTDDITIIGIQIGV